MAESKEYMTLPEENGSINISEEVIAAIAVGLVGTAFLAGSTFAVTHQPPMIPLCILLAIPGFLGWIVPWFLYRAMVRRRSRVVEKLLEKKYNEIDEICQKGHQLLT